MKFAYTYRTSDNEVHDGVIIASSREDVYQRLKGLGIKPYNVRLAPGLVNRLSSLGKRWLAIFVLAAAATAAVGVAVKMGRTVTRSESVAQMPLPRHCIEGLPDDWAGIAFSRMESLTDRILVCFAQPGRVLAATAIPLPKTEDFVAGLKTVPVIRQDDPGWVAELKRIVAGMKADILAMRRNGKTDAEIAAWLSERQIMESDYRKRVIERFGIGAITKKEANAMLSVMGLETLK